MFCKLTTNTGSTLFVDVDDDGNLRLEDFHAAGTPKSRQVWGRTLLPDQADELLRFLQSQARSRHAAATAAAVAYVEGERATRAGRPSQGKD